MMTKTSATEDAYVVYAMDTDVTGSWRSKFYFEQSLDDDNVIFIKGDIQVKPSHSVLYMCGIVTFF